MPSHRKLIESSFQRHRKAVEESSELLVDIEKSAVLLIKALRTGKKILTCGNGGSAADSQHLAGEFLAKYKDARNPLPAIALTTDTSTLTAIANDFSFEDVFSRQVKALGNRGDILVALSTSGQSKNILTALKEARGRGLKIIVLTGQKGKYLKKIADAAIVVPAEETARIQEVHELIFHIWCEIIDKNFLK